MDKMSDCRNASLAVETTNSSKVKLSIELHERIISFFDVDWDQKSIARCARVCHAWLPYSRYKLFHTVPLRNYQHWNRFKRLVMDPPPNIMPYLDTVRELDIISDIPHINDTLNGEQVGWRNGQDQPWGHLVLAYCTPRLTGLTCISMYSVDWAISPFYSKLFPSTCHYTCLTKLSIRICRFSSVFQLESFVFAFPALVDLCLQQISLDQILSVSVSSTPQRGPQLTHLHLEDTGAAIDTLSWWLITTGSLHKLLSLDWWVISPGHKAALDAMLEAIDSLDSLDTWELPDLQGSLSVTVTVMSQLTSPIAANLSRHLVLRSLSLGPTIYNHVELLKQAISQISSHRLRKLVLTIHHLPRPDLLDNFLACADGLKYIDSILARPQFHTLQHVQISFSLAISAKGIDEHLAILKLTPTAVAGASTQVVPFDGHVVPSITASHVETRTQPNNAIRRHVKELIKLRTRQACKHLSSRGILHIDVWLIIRPESNVEQEALKHGHAADITALNDALELDRADEQPVVVESVEVTQDSADNAPEGSS